MKKSRVHCWGRVVVAMMVVVAIVLGRCKAQGSASTTCNSGVIEQLSACGPYVTNAAAQPSQACCASLQSVDVSCMCQVLNGPALPNLDRNKALSLPTACNLPTAAACDTG